MGDYKQLKEKLCEELSRYNNRELSSASLDTINKIAHTIKCLNKIEESEEGNSSYRGSYNSSRNSSRGSSYDEAESGAGYASYRRRDSMGRYSRDGYSRDGVIDHLYAMMEQAHTEKEKNEIRRAIEAMEK